MAIFVTPKRNSMSGFLMVIAVITILSLLLISKQKITTQL